MLSGQLSAGNLLSYRRNRNLFALKLSDGAGEMEWISSSSFRFCRRWQAAGPKAPQITRDPVVVSATDLGARLRFVTKYLRVDVAKAGLLVRVADSKGAVLLADAGEIRREGDRLVVERETAAAERFRGLGPRVEPDAAGSRGVTIVAGTPFLMSNLGYGEYHAGARSYTFDLAHSAPGRRRVELRGGDRVEYFFYYGPTPKEILEEHVTVSGGLKQVDPDDFELLDLERVPAEAVILPARRPASWESLREALSCLFSASYSAILLPAFDLSTYASEEAELARRAAQLGSVMPVLYESRPAAGTPGKERLLRERMRLIPYLLSYAYEAQERGFPLIRPLGMQYPKDEEAVRQMDEFIVGDELLVAPVVGPGARRNVYLPMGVWTCLKTNEAYKGRQTITVSAGLDELPMFARNGSILPLAPAAQDAPMLLHYFPRLGAEFFLYEAGSGDFSQFHAAPAIGCMRLEIEPARERTYEWIVHHIEPCRKVAAGSVEYRQVNEPGQLEPGCWFYDARARNLHVRARVLAGADHIINASF